MTSRRLTLRKEVSFEGNGLHRGEPVRVRIIPAEDGIHFRKGTERILAIPEEVTGTSRCTCLGSIGTVEHLMAALAGLEVTDAEIEVAGEELPALDGSALPYAKAIRDAGVEPLGQLEVEPPFTRVFLQHENAKVAIAAGEGHWRYEYRSERWPFFQVFGAEDVIGGFFEEIAPARTFGHEADVPAIQAAGLAKGLDLSSALLIGEDDYSNRALFPDEPARHKLLDAMGDLYLAGVPLRFLNVVAQKSGHRMNVEAAAALRSLVQKN